MQLIEWIVIQRIFYIFYSCFIFRNVSSILSSLGRHRRLPSGAKAGRVIKYKFKCSRRGPRQKWEEQDSRLLSSTQNPPQLQLNSDCSLAIQCSKQDGEMLAKRYRAVIAKVPWNLQGHSGCRWLFISELAGFLRELGTSEVQPSCFYMSW